MIPQIPSCVGLVQRIDIRMYLVTHHKLKFSLFDDSNRTRDSRTLIIYVANLIEHNNREGCYYFITKIRLFAKIVVKSFTVLLTVTHGCLLCLV